MNEYGQDHRHGRSVGNFEAHRRDRGSGGCRRRRAWLFMPSNPDIFEPHYRTTSRMAALPGKHVRQVRAPEPSPHGK